MGPEVWVGIGAVFLAGGAIGSAGTLLSQWVIRKLSADAAEQPSTLAQREVSLLRNDVSDLMRQVQNLDARLDFQEQIVGGATPTTQPPPRLPRSADAEPPEA